MPRRRSTKNPPSSSLPFSASPLPSASAVPLPFTASPLEAPVFAGATLSSSSFPSLFVSLVEQALLLATGASAADKADRIFVNGRIWTGDPSRPRVEALAVRGTSILAVGKTADIRGLAEKATDVVDLKGRFVCPGFIDAHIHFMGGSLSLEALNLNGAGSLAEVERRIKDYARSHMDSGWERILKTRVLLTVLGGQDTFRAREF